MHKIEKKITKHKNLPVSGKIHQISLDILQEIQFQNQSQVPLG